MKRRSSRSSGPPPEGGYVRRVEFRRDEIDSFDRYPFNIPAVRSLEKLVFDRHFTILVGENGSGKSTLIEAIAVAIGLNAEGGSKNFNFVTEASHSVLSEYLQVVRGSVRERDAFFLRAEGVYNLATEIKRLDEGDSGPIIAGFGGISLHEQSHGESFLAMVKHRFRGGGIYVLDEPESALSPSRQITLLHLLYELSHNRSSQIVMATHSPILMALPGATLYRLSDAGIEPIAYEDTEHFKITKMFLSSPSTFLRHLAQEGHNSLGK